MQPYQDRKEHMDMGLLLSHWHCILPVFIIVIAMFFMREKPKKDNKDK